SEATANIIDAEIKALVDEGYETARKVLTEKNDDFETLAQGLLEYETLSGKEIQDLLDGKPPSRDLGDDTPPSRGSAVPSAGAGKKSKGGGEPDAPDLAPEPS
ncbi:MAG: cell division protein FtsH, partial [Pseudomonadota bacterium]